MVNCAICDSPINETDYQDLFGGLNDNTIFVFSNNHIHKGKCTISGTLIEKAYCSNCGTMIKFLDVDVKNPLE